MYINQDLGNQDLGKSTQRTSRSNQYIKFSLFAPILGLTIWSSLRSQSLKYKQFDFKFQRLDDAKKSKIITELTDCDLLFKSIDNSEKKAKSNGIHSLDALENFYFNLGRQVRFIDKKLEKNDINNSEIMFGSGFGYIFYIISKYDKSTALEDFQKLIQDKKTKEMNEMIKKLQQDKKDIFKIYLAKMLDRIYKIYLLVS